MPAEDFLRVLDEEVTPHVDPAGVLVSGDVACDMRRLSVRNGRGASAVSGRCEVRPECGAGGPRSASEMPAAGAFGGAACYIINIENFSDFCK